MIEQHVPLIREPKSLRLTMAQQRNVADVLKLVVDKMAGSDAIALARIWLIRPGEGCETCPMRSQCPDQTNCLHLVTSAGTSIVAAGNALSRIDGSFRCFPLGVRKVGRIASTGQPLVHRGQVLGVLGVFARTTIGDACLDWQRMIADHVESAIELPPLRKRKEDIALLAEHLLGVLARRLGKQVTRLTYANVAELGRYHWPGNIRELQHVIERALITSPKGKLRLELNASESTRMTPATSGSIESDEIMTASQLRTLEADNIRRALRACDGKVYGDSGAAVLLGMKPTTLSSRIKSLGISD